MTLFLTDNIFKFFPFFKKYKWISLLFILPILSISVFIINPSFAAVNSVKESVVTITAKNEPLKKVLTKISNATGYKIEITDGWENRLISLDFINTPLDASLKKIIKALGGPSNSILTIENTKSIKINIFESSARSFSNKNKVYLEEDANKVMGLDLTFAELKMLHEKQEQEFKKESQNPNAIVIPAEGDQPAVTRAQLEALHKKQEQEFKKESQDPNAIAIPANGDQPAVTRAQLEALHKKQEQEFKKESQDPNAIAIPANGDQPAVTRAQLEELHKKQQQEFEAEKQNMDEVMISAKGNKPALTRGQLDELNKEQLNSPESTVLIHE